jgi:hypothetical protein
VVVAWEEFYRLLAQLPLLTQADLRLGCVERAQIIGSLLHHQGHRVGRVWVLPVYENASFFAPLYDAANQRLMLLRDPQSGRQHALKWRYHCAAWLPDAAGQPVFDFPLSPTPLPLAAWQAQFITAQKHGNTRRKAPPEPCALRFAPHDFAVIPHRQVLRYHPRAEHQRQILPLHRLAHRLMLTRMPRARSPKPRHS